MATSSLLSVIADQQFKEALRQQAKAIADRRNRIVQNLGGAPTVVADVSTEKLLVQAKGATMAIGSLTQNIEVGDTSIDKVTVNADLLSISSGTVDLRVSQLDQKVEVKEITVNFDPEVNPTPIQFDLSLLVSILQGLLVEVAKLRAAIEQRPKKKMVIEHGERESYIKEE